MCAEGVSYVERDGVESGRAEGAAVPRAPRVRQRVAHAQRRQRHRRRHQHERRRPAGCLLTA